MRKQKLAIENKLKLFEKAPGNKLTSTIETRPHARTHSRTHARMHARTHASRHELTNSRTHALTHARMYAHTHAHKQTNNQKSVHIKHLFASTQIGNEHRYCI